MRYNALIQTSCSPFPAVLLQWSPTVQRLVVIQPCRFDLYETELHTHTHTHPMLFITSDQELKARVLSVRLTAWICPHLCQSLSWSRPSPSAQSTHFCSSRHISPSDHCSVPSIPDGQRRDERGSDRYSNVIYPHY